MATYKPYRKTDSAGTLEEIKIPYSSIDGTPTIPDVSGKANLSGGNTFTGKQTLNSPASDGYSINAAGYVKGSWLQASTISNKGANTGKVCVFDDSGWIYYRTPAEILTEAGGAKTSDIKNGALTIQKNGADVATFTANQSSSVTANITVPTKASDVDALPISGGALTGGISAPNISTGTDAANYFQSQKFRGEGNADTYYHAVDFGYAGHNQVDFHEYGGLYNFYQNTSGAPDSGSLVGAFTPDGIKEGEQLLKDKYLGKSGGTVTGDLTVGGNLTINGTTTTVDSTTLQVKDKLIEVAHGNTAALTTPAGLVAPKYDGTNSGALVFDSDGIASVGDVVLDASGNIDVTRSQLQPLATRTGLVGGNLVQYDSSAQTLKDSGKKINDLALKTDISGKLSKTENTGVSVLGTTKSTTTLGGNQLVAPNGIIFAGTAANAGLVTRGICGVSTPDSKGACSKDNLYINYDGTNTYDTGRMLILQAGETGTNYGNNMYQYAVPRGDIVKAWVESKGYATTSQVEARYEKPTDGIPKTDLESAVQTSLSKADNALSLDGGTIKKGKTIKMDASANSDGANLKWGTVNSRNPYIGYASDQTDGTFVVGSLLGTNYASGLAIGGGSGNLLWKGTKVATTNDVPEFSFENGVLTITTK